MKCISQIVEETCPGPPTSEWRPGSVLKEAPSGSFAFFDVAVETLLLVLVEGGFDPFSGFLKNLFDSWPHLLAEDQEILACACDGVPENGLLARVEIELAGQLASDGSSDAIG